MGARFSRATRKANKKDRKSQKGGDYGFSGPAFMTSAGAPVESRMDQIDCMEVDRPAPVLQASYGGARRSRSRSRSRSRKQKGGACGCNALRLQQTGGGGGTGGYSVDVGANDIGKLYSAVTPGNCATVPLRAMVGGRKKTHKQRGGDSAASVYGLQSYSTGLDMNKPVELPNGSAHYLDWTAYDKTCRGGARRNRNRNQKKH